MILSGPILLDFGPVGLRVSCPDDPLLALRLRQALKNISAIHSQREMRKWAPSSAHTCDICLEQTGHVFFDVAKVQTS